MDGEAAWRNRPSVQRIYALDAKVAGNDDRARSLALFASVVEEGSFSAAGRTLGLTPSAVARAIDRIEARLGVRLLLRSTRALTLTAEGKPICLRRGASSPISTTPSSRSPIRARRADGCGSARRWRMAGCASCLCSAILRALIRTS